MGAIKITKVTDYIGDYYILSGEGKSWYGICCLSVQDACSAIVCDLPGYQAHSSKFTGNVKWSFLLFQDGVSSACPFPPSKGWRRSTDGDRVERKSGEATLKHTA